MSRTGVVMEWQVPTGPLDGLWGRQFKKIETRIGAAEHESLRARWESGKHLLIARTDKMFDRGFRQALEQEHGLKQFEISCRMRFTEAYPSEQELNDAVIKFGSWHQLCAKGLPKTRQRTAQAQPVTRMRAAIKSVLKFKDTITPGTLQRADVEQLEALRVWMDKLFEAIDEQERGAR